MIVSGGERGSTSLTDLSAHKWQQLAAAAYHQVVDDAHGLRNGECESSSISQTTAAMYDTGMSDIQYFVLHPAIITSTLIQVSAQAVADHTNASGEWVSMRSYQGILTEYHTRADCTKLFTRRCVMPGSCAPHRL